MRQTEAIWVPASRRSWIAAEHVDWTVVFAQRGSIAVMQENGREMHNAANEKTGSQ